MAIFACAGVDCRPCEVTAKGQRGDGVVHLDEGGVLGWRQDESAGEPEEEAGPAGCWEAPPCRAREELVSLPRRRQPPSVGSEAELEGELLTAEADPGQAVRSGPLSARVRVPPSRGLAWPWWPRPREHEEYQSLAARLQELYAEKLLPLERESSFHVFQSAELPPAHFSSRPMVLLMGHYSTGKTTFVRHLLGEDYQGMHIGPEPTTDKFTVICHGREPQVTPGNAVVCDRRLPYAPLAGFGNSFLSRLACSQLPNPLLESATFVDTPGVLSGGAERGYDFQEVISWFVEQAAVVLVFFDVNKPDVSEELGRCIARFPGASQKLRIVLNKADRVTAKELIRVHGALIWSLGKVLDTPEVARVYVISLADEPVESEEQRAILEQERQDLCSHIRRLPYGGPWQRINELSRRAHLVKAHALLMEHLRASMPTLWGHAERQRELLRSLPSVVRRVSQQERVPLGDFPAIDVPLRLRLAEHDFSKLPRLDRAKLDTLASLLQEDIPSVVESLEADRGWQSLAAGGL